MDDSTTLFAEGAVYLGTPWPGSGTDQYFDFAQLVLEDNGIAQPLGISGHFGSILFTGDAGTLATLSLVPEPGSLTLVGIGIGCVGLVLLPRLRGRRKTAR